MYRRSCSLDMGEVKYTDLKISLYELQEDVQRLQDDLEAERESAATSASEAMAVILKLQGEKAMIAMEVNQYQRMTEEKMSHDEMSLTLLENLNFKKEDEIKNLKFMLNEYESKLESLGYNDFDRSQNPFPEQVTEISVVKEESLDLRRLQEHNSLLLEQKLKKLVSVENEKGLIKSKFLVKKMSKKSSKSKRDNVQGSCHVIDSVLQDELQKLKERMDKLEQERSKEDMNIQREVDEEISSVQSIENSRITLKLPLLNHNPSVFDVQEAMLYFWI